jgi:hypothetical protein
MADSAATPPASSSGDLVTVASFRDLSEALVLKGRLNSAGLTCFLLDDNIVRLNWYWSSLMKGVKLQVPLSEAEMARSLILNEGEPEPGETQIPVCPRCSSRQVAVVDPMRGIRLAALWVIGIPLPRIEEPYWKCAECGSAWVDDDDDEPNPKATQ